MKTRRILVSDQVCIGCHLCEVHCQVAHSRSKNLLKTFKKDAAPPLARVHVEEDGAISMAVRCFHCEDAPCVSACLTGAMQKNPITGVVTADPERCMGCWTCVMVCPYGAPVRDEEHHMIVKCDFCQDRETPACVAACPNRAMLLVEEEAPA
jgi:carbon-monoxide dehydrogenase iron sulfur subunit